MSEISIESEVNKNIENPINDSLVSIEINDIFDQLNEENHRLRKQLFLSNKYNIILEKFKQYLDLNSNKCQCFESNRNQLNLIYDEFNEFFNNEENNYFEQNYREIINYLNISKNKDNNNSNKLIIKPIVNKARKSFNSQLNNSNYNNNNNNNNNNEKSSICESKVKKEVKYPWNPRHRCLWIGCNFKTDKKKVLNDHMNIHKEVRPYLCTDGKCGKTFFSEKSLKAHRKRHLTGKRYKLSTNNEELANSKTYFETKKLKLKSIKSGKRVKNKSEIKVEELDNNSTEVQMNNNRDININNDNKCDNNNTVKKYRRNLRHKCCWVGCDFKTEKKLILKDHMNIHKNIRPYVCQEPNCGKRYFSSKSLGSHRKRHLNTGSYKCSYSECSFNGRTLNIVMAHIKLVHSVDKPYYCSHCELYFETEFSFKRHLVSHLETNYKCDYPNCPYRSNQLSKFNVHLRKHTGEKPFKCEWPGCEKIFSRLDGLKDHQIRHSDLRPFHCSWPGCESKFKRANDLKMHSNYHTNERLLKCDWPGCEFRTLTNKVLKEHEMKHNGESYDCTWNKCDKKFKLKDDLDNHLYLHSNPLKCDWPGCEKTYTLKSSFKYHMHAHRRQLK